MDLEGRLYTIDNTDLTISEALVGITEGLNDMNPGHGDSGFEGGIAMLLRIPAEWAEIVESAAKRNGVILSLVENDLGGF